MEWRRTVWEKHREIIRQMFAPVTQLKSHKEAVQRAAPGTKSADEGVGARTGGPPHWL